MSPRYDTTSDLPMRLPVFPLAGTILLPRAVLPLNVFEPRYLAMINDTLTTHRLVGIVQPAGDGGETGSPQSRSAPLARVGCAGRITMFQENDDGRLLIALTGVARFRLGEETDMARPFRTFNAVYQSYAADLDAGHGEDGVDRDRLLSALKRFLDLRKLAMDWRQISEAGSEQLVNWLSIASPFGASEKQGLIEAPTLAARAEMLITLAEMEIAAGGAEAGKRIQ